MFNVSYYAVVFAVLLVGSTCGQRTDSNRGCSFKLPQDIPENEPVYLSEKSGRLVLYTPTGQLNSFRENDEITVFCPGKGNTLSINNQKMSELRCKSDQRFGTKAIDWEWNRINCTKENTGDLRVTLQQCANGRGTINEIGFQIDESTFIKLFDVCYSNPTASLLWSRNTITGAAIEFNVRESERREFRTAGIPATAMPRDSYKKTTATKHFQRVLGNAQAYFNDTSFLSRGHMTADADFVFSAHQFATYFYVNVVPQFQAINSGNWLRVESLTRRLAATLRTNLVTYSGVYGQLQLADTAGVLQRLALEDSGLIEVPQWTWKVLLDKANDAALVMITLNNPFAVDDSIEEFCPNVCAAAGFVTKKTREVNRALYVVRKGYTFCCALADFKRVVDTLPATVTATKLLQVVNSDFN